MRRKLLKVTFLSSIAAITVGIPRAHADELSDIKAQMNAMSAQMAALKAEEAKLAAEEAGEHQEVAAQKQHQQESEKSMIVRQVQLQQAVEQQNAAANKALQALTPTRAARQGLSNNEYVTGGVLPGSFIIPGTNTSVRIGGFIQLHAIYNQTQDLGPRFQIGNLLPNSPAQRATEGNIFFQGKLSRFIFQTSTPSRFGPVTTDFAIDLDGFVNGGDRTVALQNNSDSARMVFAYGTIGPLAFGQMWSNFVDVQDVGETLDNTGPAGVPAERNIQLAYSIPFNKTSVLTLAVADPQSAYEDTHDNIEVSSITTPVPDFSVNYTYTSDAGDFQISGVTQVPAYTDINGTRHQLFTAAGIVGGTLNLEAVNKTFGDDNLGGQIWFGGIGRYMPDDFGGNVASLMAIDDGTAANPTAVTSIKLQMDHGFTVFYQHYWSKRWRSSVSIGYNHQNLASFLPADLNNAPETKTIHINLIFRPVKSVDLGFEYMAGQKDFQKNTGQGPKNAFSMQFAGIWHF